ncbi:transglycosylase domain-containing protein [Mucilaginibacter sp.]|uniref:transglycosylase domain-containing protein n=1 Tax=Mucilaginibacter sp. TaxID=1882438 RepID=UPI0035BC0753
MRRINPKYIRIAGIVAAVIVVVMLIGGYIAYSKREVLLQKAISKAKAKAKRDYNLDVKIGSAHFTGISTVAFSDISVVPYQRDSLFSVKRFDVSVKLFPLIFGTIKLADVVVQNGHLNLTNNKGVKNFDFLFKKKKDTTSTRKVDLSELSNNLINDVLYKIPDNLSLTNFLVSYRDDTTRMSALAQTAVINSGKLASTIKVDDGAAQATWHFDGKMHASDKDIDVRLYADGKKVELPILQKKFKVKLNFDTLTTKLTKVSNSSGETKIFSYLSVRNLLINHPGLSTTDIVVPSGAIDANVFVGENYVSLDSSSVIHLKKITANPYIKYTLKPVKIYELKVHTDWQNAQDIFDSFPTGMFESLEGIKVAGKLSYNLNLFYNSKQLDNLQFDSRLDKDNFRIISYGKTDLGKLNKTFVYTPYEKGKPMPPHVIGPENVDFTPLEQISPNLRNAVMTAEDPSFYRNKGFVEESIRKSIITDIKDHKFKRGGSTISMQLVKNAFLSRNKTLSRKIEEILIVWMIENNRIMSKNRMLEVYFNIIEWGRGIYGIGEAARYYFGKSPSELSLGESIFLASIVPNPKAGLYAFEADGSLRGRLHGYFNLIGRLMAGKGLTARDSNAYGFYSVRLKESLRRTIAPIDTATADSLIKQTAEDEGVGVAPVFEEPKRPSFIQRLFGKKDTTPAAKAEEKVKETNDMIKQRLKQEISAMKDDYKRRIDNVDTAGKTKQEIKDEKKRLKQESKDKEKELKAKMP